jgi:hypothetical protein
MCGRILGVVLWIREELQDASVMAAVIGLLLCNCDMAMVHRCMTMELPRQRLPISLALLLFTAL